MLIIVKRTNSSLPVPIRGSSLRSPPETRIRVSGALCSRTRSCSEVSQPPSSILATLASRLLKIPTTGYFDGFGLVTPLPLIEDTLLLFTELSRILGFELKLSKSGRGHILEFLGLVIDLTLVPGKPPNLYLSQQRKDKLRAQISESVETGWASAAALQKLVGKVLCLNSRNGKDCSSHTPSFVYPTLVGWSNSGLLPFFSESIRMAASGSVHLGP